MIHLDLHLPVQTLKTLGGLRHLPKVTQLVSGKVENLSRSSDSISFPQAQGKGEKLRLKTIRCRLTSMRARKVCGRRDLWTFPLRRAGNKYLHEICMSLR